MKNLNDPSGIETTTFRKDVLRHSNLQQFNKTSNIPQQIVWKVVVVVVVVVLVLVVL